MRVFYLFISLAFSPIILSSQDIRLENPSFEGEPQDATVPTGWMPCEAGTTPDILPGPWGVYQEASDGDTFLGLITRADGTYESIGQRLTTPLKKGECYSWSLDLAHSNTYAGYNQPLQLRIWATLSRCSASDSSSQKLYESNLLIEHSEWKTYSFSFFSESEYNYIIIEAFVPGNGAARGNILIDNCSKIIPCKRA